MARMLTGSLVFMGTTGCLSGVEEPSGMWQSVFHGWNGAQVEPPAILATAVGAESRPMMHPCFYPIKWPKMTGIHERASFPGLG